MLGMVKKETIAMLLAGGQGSRLGVLTNSVAKPAVPFGGKYRIIDFTLSNCVNSGIDTIGVLTQYQPLELNTYIGSGQPWDLDRLFGGVTILPPHIKGSHGEWYKGTANAIFQNIHYIETYNPEYIVVLSGDHIYKMNYRWMLNYHKEKKADCTISVLNVPYEEASRFGIMNADADFRIFEFEEKPENPKGTLASMGVYIFTWKKLREYLSRDENDEESENDFGKDIIPSMLDGGERLFAYEFKGYWKDVGTIESLWEANMDLLDPNVPIQLDDPLWKMYSRNNVLPPQFIGGDSVIENSYVTEGCKIDGMVKRSILFPGVTVEKGALVNQSIIMPNATVREGAVVEYSILAPESVIGAGARVGVAEGMDDASRRQNITVVGRGSSIGDHAEVEVGQTVSGNLPGKEEGEAQC
ncbi:MAG: glucose-1-phosphate adenylyltransferase [Clostridiales bacterium]|nr:glucose-1-phosphate adenylyltransferase [Clostridiales bacterium]